MSHNLTLNKTRFRKNNQMYTNQYNSLIKDVPQIKTSDNSKSNKFIPLTLKNMNPVEKYVNQCKITENLQKLLRPKRSRINQLYDPFLSQSKHLEKIFSSVTETRLEEQQLKDLDLKCYVKYSSVSAHGSSEKMKEIQKAQNQYVRLKHSINIFGGSQQVRSMIPQTRPNHTQSQYNSQTLQKIKQSFVNNKSILLLQKKKIKQKQPAQDNIFISDQEIQKELKTSIIEQGGKKYFADLYLMKRVRDKKFQEIFQTNGKTKSIYNHQQTLNHTNASANLNSQVQKFINTTKGINSKGSQKKLPQIKINMAQSYDQKKKNEEQNYVQQKILKDRSEKKEKMLKGRNMNWNIYYEMFALKKSEKNKLKEYCKFSQTYGED